MDEKPDKAREQPRLPARALLIEWDVLVRHSPFLLKNARVQAITAEDAKQQFLTLVRQKHEERVSKQKADEQGRLAVQRIRLVLSDGLKRLDELEWEIRPAAEVDAAQRAYRDRIDQVWGNVREPQLA